MQNRTLFTARPLLQGTMPSLTALYTENGRPRRRACCFKPRPVPRGIWKSTIIAGFAYLRTRYSRYLQAIRNPNIGPCMSG